MGIGKDQLVYDPTNGGDQVSVYELTLLSKAEDSGHTSGDRGIQLLAVRNDAGVALAGTDLDYIPLSTDNVGRLRTVTAITINAEKAEDSAHASGDTGSYILSVRQDTPASSTSADGDYQSVKTDALGRTWVNDSGHSFDHNAVSVAATATQITAAPLANRKKILIRNNSSKAIFIGNSGMTDTTTGIPISAGSSLELNAGAAVDLYAIVASGTADVRYLELS